MSLTRDAQLVQAEFAKINVRVTDAALLGRCAELLVTHNVDAEALVTQWEAEALKRGLRGNDRALSGETLDAVAKALSKRVPVKAEASHGQGTPSASKPRRSVNIDGLLGGAVDTLPATPAYKRTRAALPDDAMDVDAPSQLKDDPISPTQRTPQSQSKYAQRKEAGKVALTHNAHVGALQGSEARNVHVELVNPLLEPYALMWEQPELQQAAVEARLAALGDALLERYGLGAPSSTWHLASQETVVAVGVIALDEDERSDAPAQHALTAANVVLQGRAGTNGEVPRVRLDLIELSEAELFAGQVVAVEGVNPYGSRLIVKRLCTDAPPPPPLRTALPAPLTVVVACGPFTPTDDLLYEPLSDLLAAVRAARAQLLVLCGPFVDSAHPAVSAGAVEEASFAALFERRVLAALRDVAEGCRVVLVPSTRDAHLMPVLPQPAAQGVDTRSKLADLQHVAFAPNPAVFLAGGVSFGVASADVLWHLNKVGLSRQITAAEGATLQPKRVRLLRSVLGQQSFYPLAPPVTAPDDPVAVSAAQAARLDMPFAPDVLLLPSQHPQFVHEVDGVLCVNPGRLVRADAGGTYAVLHVRPDSVDKGPLASKTRVDVVRI